jgi:hypothetical protein
MDIKNRIILTNFINTVEFYLYIVYINTIYSTFPKNKGE